jgi:hypothetical protein
MLDTINTLTTTLSYTGEYSNIKKYNFGDVVIKNGNTYIYTLEGWELICKAPSSPTTTPTPKFEYRPKICPQCGAPFHGNKCEYCGTEFY